VLVDPSLSMDVVIGQWSGSMVRRYPKVDMKIALTMYFVPK
jgi:hypothetical protein